MNMEAKTCGTTDALERITTRAPMIYKSAIKGTSFSETLATLFKPPRITKAAIITSTIPVTQAGTLNALVIFPAMELTWLMFPMPKLAKRQKRQKRKARTQPIFFMPL